MTGRASSEDVRSGGQAEKTSQKLSLRDDNSAGDVNAGASIQSYRVRKAVIRRMPLPERPRFSIHALATLAPSASEPTRR